MIKVTYAKKPGKLSAARYAAHKAHVRRWIEGVAKAREARPGVATFAPASVAARAAAAVTVEVNPREYLAQDPSELPRYVDWDDNGKMDAVYLIFLLLVAGTYVLQELSNDGFTWLDRTVLTVEANAGFWGVGDGLNESTGIKKHIFRLTRRIA